MSCSDDLKNIDWNMPQMPCDDIGNMKKWKSYNEAIGPWAKKEDVARVFKQCVCKNASRCYANRKCSNDIFSNVGDALADPACMECISQSPECKPFAEGMSKYGIITKTAKKVQYSGDITPDLVGSMVKETCKIDINSPLSQKIANILNGKSEPDTDTDTTNKNKTKENTSDDSSSPVWTKTQTWITIGVVAIIIFLTGVWMYSRRSKVSRHVVTQK